MRTQDDDNKKSLLYLLDRHSFHVVASVEDENTFPFTYAFLTRGEEKKSNNASHAEGRKKKE